MARRTKSMLQLQTQMNRIYNAAERQGRDVRAGRAFNAYRRYMQNAFPYSGGEIGNLSAEQQNRQIPTRVYMGLANG